MIVHNYKKLLCVEVLTLIMFEFHQVNSEPRIPKIYIIVHGKACQL